MLYPITLHRHQSVKLNSHIFYDGLEVFYSSNFNSKCPKMGLNVTKCCYLKTDKFIINILFIKKKSSNMQQHMQSVNKYILRFLLFSLSPLCPDQLQHPTCSFHVSTRDSHFGVKWLGNESGHAQSSQCCSVQSYTPNAYMVWHVCNYTFTRMVHNVATLLYELPQYLCLRFLYCDSIYTDGELYFRRLVSFCFPQLLVEFQFTDPFLHHLNTLWLVHFCVPQKL